MENEPRDDEQMNLKDSILQMVTQRNYVTFAELSRLPGFGGEDSFMANERENIVLWPSISEKGADALIQLRAEEKIFMHPAEMLSYVCDGVVPMLPIAKRPPKKGYKKPHWLPVCFCSFPLPRAQ